MIPDFYIKYGRSSTATISTCSGDNVLYTTNDSDEKDFCDEKKNPLRRAVGLW